MTAIPHMGTSSRAGKLSIVMVSFFTSLPVQSSIRQRAVSFSLLPI